MRVSARTKYALKVLLELGLCQEAGGAVTAARIAQSQHVPLRFLEQILLVLRRAGVVGSSRGAHGGYRLLSDPTELTVRAVVELTQPSLLAPVSASGELGDADEILADVWRSIDSLVRDELESRTVRDVMDRYLEQVKSAPDYVI